MHLIPFSRLSAQSLDSLTGNDFFKRHSTTREQAIGALLHQLARHGHPRQMVPGQYRTRHHDQDK